MKLKVGGVAALITPNLQYFNMHGSSVFFKTELEVNSPKLISNVILNTPVVYTYYIRTSLHASRKRTEGEDKFILILEPFLDV